jgi:short-subunit dehydrogenase
MATRRKENKKVILLTGCSSGLGLALAQHLASMNKYRLVITAREKSFVSLMKWFKPSDNLIMRPLDVTDDAQIYHIANEVCVLWGKVDVLVNNAGVCFRSVVEHMDADAEAIQLKTNYLGPMNLIRALIPTMREAGYGHIINVSSVAGMVSMPTMASYSASKHALEGATEALWYEAKPYGIHVTLVQPGFIHSESFLRVILSKKAELSSKIGGPHSEYYDSMSPFIARLMDYSFSSPLSIARKIQKIIEMKNPPLRKPVTYDAILFSLLRRFLPASLFHRIMFSLLPGSKTWGRN